MKKIKLFILLVLCFTLCSCEIPGMGTPSKPKPSDEEKEEETFEVTFVEDGVVLKVVEVKAGENVEIPELDTPVGYYYAPNYYEIEAENIQQDKTLELVLKEYWF